MKKIVILILFGLLASCGSKRVVTNEKTVYDTLVVEKTVRLRDTTIVVGESTSRIALPVLELTKTPVVKKHGQATVTLQKVNDTIYAEAKCEELELKLQLKDSIIREQHNRVESLLTTIENDAKKTTWIQRTLNNIGFAILLILSTLGIIFLITLIKKWILKR